MRARLFMAAVLLAASLVGLTVATAAPAAAVGCWGDYCSGQDPESTGCSADAYTLAADESYGTGAYVELRWSPTCKTEWARVPRTNWPGGDSLGVIQSTGYSQGYSNQNAYYVWSKMIYSPKLCVYAWWRDYSSPGTLWDYAQTSCV